MKSMEALLNKSSKLRDIHGKVEADSRQGELIQQVSMFFVFCVFLFKPTTPLVGHQCDDPAQDHLRSYGQSLWRSCHKFGEIPCKWQAGRYVTLINQKVQPYKWNHWFPWPINTFNKRWLQWCICSVVFLWPTPRLLKNIKNQLEYAEVL